MTDALDRAREAAAHERGRARVNILDVALATISRIACEKRGRSHGMLTITGQAL